MRLRSNLVAGGFLVAAFAACTYDSSLQFGVGPDGIVPGGSSSGGRPEAKPCTTNAECGADVCIQGGCFPSTAGDGKVNGTESDVDCGGTAAPPCAEGKRCRAPLDCASDICRDGTCQPPRPDDGVKNADETGIDCGGSVAPRCADGLGCAADTDCASAVCKQTVCRAATLTDGVKNGTETGIDCGGPGAPACVDGLGCLTGADCTSLVCAAEVCQTPTYTDGVRNGVETDTDCGGAGAPADKRCTVGKLCLAGGDCSSDGCVADGPAVGTCARAPSCTRTHGGFTCGLGENAEGAPLGTHEDCCTSLEVPGYSEPDHAGKRVLLDKFEVTAGRVREFLTRITSRSDALGQGAKPDVKSWLEAGPAPVRWQPSWNQFLPSDDVGGFVDPLPHPGNGISGAGPMGVNYALSYAIYVYAHGDNCVRPAGQTSFSSPTYWMTPQVLGGLAYPQAARGISQALLDQKSINCIPNALLAAFCAWDGGQLATAEVLQAASSNGAGLPPLSAAFGSSDGGTPTGYTYPGGSGDGADRIAAPGRAANDKTMLGAAGPWHDLRGNVLEAAICKSNAISISGGDIIDRGRAFCGSAAGPEANWFGLAFEGYGYSSSRAGGSSHDGNIRYPEYKTAYAGGRCMRFAD